MWHSPYLQEFCIFFPHMHTEEKSPEANRRETGICCILHKLLPSDRTGHYGTSTDTVKGGNAIEENKGFSGNKDPEKTGCTD